MIRKTYFVVICSAAAISFTSPIFAQTDPAGQSATTPVILAPAQGNIIRAGTEVILNGISSF